MNVARWESEAAMNDAREAVENARQLSSKNQSMIFKQLGVEVTAENYVDEVRY